MKVVLTGANNEACAVCSKEKTNPTLDLAFIEVGKFDKDEWQDRDDEAIEVRVSKYGEVDNGVDHNTRNPNIV